MIDNFSILLSHVLIALMFYLLLSRDDLDGEDPPVPDEEKKAFLRKPSASLKKQKESQMRRNLAGPTKSTNRKNENIRA